MVAIASCIGGGSVGLAVLTVEHCRLTHDAARDAEYEMVEVWMRMEDTNISVTGEGSILKGMLGM